MEWMIKEGPKLSERVRADVTTVLDGLKDEVENYAARGPINKNTAHSPEAATISGAIRTTSTPNMTVAAPLRIQPNAQDHTGIIAAVEARRQQLEAELAALAVIQESASAIDTTMRMPEVPID